MEKLYIRKVPITPKDEMHLQVDHYLNPVDPTHTTDNQLEPKERYEKAKKFLNNPDSNALPLNMVLDAIWIAAYGGCVFCKSGTHKQVDNMYACEYCRNEVK